MRCCAMRFLVSFVFVGWPIFFFPFAQWLSFGQNNKIFSSFFDIYFFTIFYLFFIYFIFYYFFNLLLFSSLFLVHV